MFPMLGQVTIPDVGVEVTDYVTALGTALGTTVAVCVGVYFAFLAVRKAYLEVISL